MYPTFDFAEALQRLRNGERVTRLSDDTRMSLVLIAGRDITVSYSPMKEHVGEGTNMWVQDHVDAIYDNESGPVCVVGYQFTQDDIMASDWCVWGTRASHSAA